MNLNARRLALEAVSLLILLANALNAAAPVAKISVVAPQNLIAGDRVVLDSSASTGVKLRLWDVLEKGPDGRDMILYQQDDADDVKPLLGPYAGTWTVQLTVIGDSPREKNIATVKVTIPGSGPDCPICPKPVPPIPPGPIPIPPAPPLPIPPQPAPLPNPDTIPAGTYGIAPKMAKLVQGVYLARSATVLPTAPDRAAQLAAVRVAWASEVDQTAATAETIAAQIAAGTLKNALDISKSLMAPKTLGWDVATASLNAMVMEIYKANKTKLKLSVTGNIDAPQEWAELINEIAAGIKGAK